MTIYKVKSFTDPKKFYTVRHFDNDLWKCDCINFIVNERRIGMCDHIRKARHLRMKRHGRKAKK